MFFTEEKYMTHSQQLFKAVVETYNIKAAFVATCNEVFHHFALTFIQKSNCRPTFLNGIRVVL